MRLTAKKGKRERRGTHIGLPSILLRYPRKHEEAPFRPRPDFEPRALEDVTHQVPPFLVFLLELPVVADVTLEGADGSFLERRRSRVRELDVQVADRSSDGGGRNCPADPPACEGIGGSDAKAAKSGGRCKFNGVERTKKCFKSKKCFNHFLDADFPYAHFRKQTRGGSKSFSSRSKASQLTRL